MNTQKHTKDDKTQMLGATLGIVIKQLRNNRGLTQDDLGVAVEVDRKHIGRIENGEKIPSLILLIAIAEALKIKTSEILQKCESDTSNDY